MRMMLHIKLPNDDFNDAVREGQAGKILNRILEDAAPEATYFTELDGQRAAVMIVNVDDPSEIPAYAEPWFLAFDAEVEFKICMTPDDLMKSGLLWHFRYRCRRCYGNDRRCNRLVDYWICLLTFRVCIVFTKHLVDLFRRHLPRQIFLVCNF